MSMKQYSKMTKASLVRKIMKALKKLPKMKLAKLCYELEKKRLPSISTTKKGMPRLTARRAFTKKNRELVKLGDYSNLDKFVRERRVRNKRKKRRTAKQLANDKRLGLMAKRRAKAKRRRR